MTTFSSSLD